ncbi:unnamed protein product [Merluccius merluccius]
MTPCRYRRRALRFPAVVPLLVQQGAVRSCCLASLRRWPAFNGSPPPRETPGRAVPCHRYRHAVPVRPGRFDVSKTATLCLGSHHFDALCRESPLFQHQHFDVVQP